MDVLSEGSMQPGDQKILERSITMSNLAFIVMVLIAAGGIVFIVFEFTKNMDITRLWGGGGENDPIAYGVLAVIVGCIIAAITRYRGSLIRQDLSSQTIVQVRAAVVKKEIENGKECEIDFDGDVGDIDVTRDVCDQIEVGDTCIIERAKLSKIVFRAWRESDGLVLR